MGQMEGMMNLDSLTLFNKFPGTLPLYEALEKRILAEFSDVTAQAKATQVSFYNTHAFAWASPPFRRIKNSPKVYLQVTFGLDHQLVHSRIAVSVEPYPTRWTHHVIVAHGDEIDEQLMGWIGESYRF